MAGNQKGITLMSFVIVLVVVGFFAMVAMKLFPIYSEYYNLKGVMSEFAAQPNSASVAPAQMYTEMDRRFNVAYIESVDSRKNMKIVRSGRNAQLNVVYEVRKPLFGNLDVVAHFDHTVDLNGTAPGG